MEIDEHLKYTLYILPQKGLNSATLLTLILACNLIPAQEPENRWFHDVSLFLRPILVTLYSF